MTRNHPLSRLGRPSPLALAALMLTIGHVRRAMDFAEAAALTDPPAELPADFERLVAEPYQSGALGATESGARGARTKVRPLFSFEDGADGQPVRAFTKRGDNMDIIYVQDNGVTDGKWCARVTVPKAVSWGATILGGEPIKDWGDHDYFAMDLYTEDDHPYHIYFELWDQASRNYHTRCTYENAVTRPGQQTLLYRINRARRNGKEGRDWSELEPQDKIDLNNLKMVKIFTTPRKDRPAMFWIDNLRLMQEDAAKPKMHVRLPRAVTAAFDFGSTPVPGFTAVTRSTRFTDQLGHGFILTDRLVQGGKGWPDLLAGTYVRATARHRLQFKTRVPNGEYLVWLCAGPVLSVEQTDPAFMLKVNDQVLHEDEPRFADYDSETYLYRFLWTQYSERPHARWLDYVDRMFPVWQEKIRVTNGEVVLEASDYFVSALILAPADQEADFRRMAAKIQAARIASFEAALYIPEREKPKPRPGDGDYLIYVPDPWRSVGPSAGPTDVERARRKLAAAAAPGQNVFLRLAVVPFTDLGGCELKLADLASTGGTTIPQSCIRGHVKNHRPAGRDLGEMILLPTTKFRGEKGLTQSLWLWLSVPDDARPGKYRGTFAFCPTNGAEAPIPVEIEVYPFSLAKTLPVSYGMYYRGRYAPRPPGDLYWDSIRKQLRWMKRIGFTSTALMARAWVPSINANGTANIRFDPTGAKIVREEGFGQHPSQLQMTSQLGVARAIGRRLFPSRDRTGSPVDKNPGIEMTHARFRQYWFDTMRKYKAHLDSLGVAYAIEIVDEPREVPNPWNRNLTHTNTYGDWMAEVGFRTRFVTPMGDTNGGKDYTSLVDHTDIVSLHAWPRSRKLVEAAKRKGKALWFYNSGMSRYMWGLYPWAQGATGRFEWHWSFPSAGSGQGYPGSDWYNPFTSPDGYACNAPVARYPGGFLYKTALLTVADGITDYTYLYTLEQAIARHRSAATERDTVRSAEAFLQRLRARVPLFPKDEGTQELIEQLDAMRSQMAGFLMKLN